jgi:hypothetical protein
MHDISISASTLVCVSYTWGGEVGDVLGEGVLGTDAACIDGAGFTGFGEGIVAGIEVLAFLEVFG